VFVSDALADPLTGFTRPWPPGEPPFGGGRLVSLALSRVTAHALAFRQADDPGARRAAWDDHLAAGASPPRRLRRAGRPAGSRSGRRQRRRPRAPGGVHADPRRRTAGRAAHRRPLAEGRVGRSGPALPSADERWWTLRGYAQPRPARPSHPPAAMRRAGVPGLRPAGGARRGGAGGGLNGARRGRLAARRGLSRLRRRPIDRRWLDRRIPAGQ